MPAWVIGLLTAPGGVIGGWAGVWLCVRPLRRTVRVHASEIVKVHQIATDAFLAAALNPVEWPYKAGEHLTIPPLDHETAAWPPYEAGGQVELVPQPGDELWTEYVCTGCGARYSALPYTTSPHKCPPGEQADGHA